MRGRLSRYSGIHDFVAALSMPNALVNATGDQAFERYYAPTTQQAISIWKVQRNCLIA